MESRGWKRSLTSLHNSVNTRGSRFKKVEKSQPNSPKTETVSNLLKPKPIRPNQPILTNSTSSSNNEIELPDGWVHLTNEFFENKKNNINQDSIKKYFEIRDPTWEDIVSEQIPHRKIVDDLIDKLNRNLDSPLRMTVLLGSGCSGKSTTLYQAVYKLVTSNSRYQVIWWQYPSETNKEQDSLFLSKLDKNKYLIFCDSPSRQDIKNILSRLDPKKPNSADIKILFSCRSTVWQTYCKNLLRNIPPQWYQEINMPELDSNETDIILTKLESKGLLDTIKKDDIKMKLLTRDRSRETLNFLALRLFCNNQTIDDDVKTRIDRILSDLGDKSKSKAKDILDTYAFIVAMHKEGLPFLRQKILAQAIGRKLITFRQEILDEIGKEIIISNEDQPIYTLHQTIAEAVYNIIPTLEILPGLDYRIDFEQNIYPRLAEAAQNLVEQGSIARQGNEINNWQYAFSDHFAKSNPPRMSLAIRIAERLFEIGSQHQQLLTRLAKLYRDNGQSDKSLELFREKYSGNTDRKYYHEWSLCERENENYANTVRVCAIALSDSINPPLDGESTMIYLSTMGFAFWKLNKDTADIWANALGASAQLAININSKVYFKDSERIRIMGDLQENLQRSRRLGVTELNPQTDFQPLFQKLKSGIGQACNLSLQEAGRCKSKKLPDKLNNIQLEFNQLESILSRF